MAFLPSSQLVRSLSSFGNENAVFPCLWRSCIPVARDCTSWLAGPERDSPSGPCLSAAVQAGGQLQRGHRGGLSVQPSETVWVSGVLGPLCTPVEFLYARIPSLSSPCQGWLPHHPPHVTALWKQGSTLDADWSIHRPFEVLLQPSNVLEHAHLCGTLCGISSWKASQKALWGLSLGTGRGGGGGLG